MTTITVARDIHGDDEVHMAGCRDLRQPKYRRYDRACWGDYSGETLLDAIIAADQDMADAFGEEPYSDPATQGSQPWSIEAIRHAPCFASSLKADGITFSGPWGRPEVTA